MCPVLFCESLRDLFGWLKGDWVIWPTWALADRQKADKDWKSSLLGLQKKDSVLYGYLNWFKNDYRVSITLKSAPILVHFCVFVMSLHLRVALSSGAPKDVFKAIVLRKDQIQTIFVLFQVPFQILRGTRIERFIIAFDSLHWLFSIPINFFVF